MAEIPVQLRGTLYDLASKSARQVFFDGVAWRSDLSVGGGPVYPPSGGGGGGKPDHIWGGGNEPFPTPPIEIPDVPPETPPGTVVKPPPSNGGWGYVHPYGWAYFPGPGQAGPKA